LRASIRSSLRPGGGPAGLVWPESVVSTLPP
jgi:hypothetical protein